jgi:hypothetical protein
VFVEDVVRRRYDFLGELAQGTGGSSEEAPTLHPVLKRVKSVTSPGILPGSPLSSSLLAEKLLLRLPPFVASLSESTEPLEFNIFNSFYHVQPQSAVELAQLFISRCTIPLCDNLVNRVQAPPPHPRHHHSTTPGADLVQTSGETPCVDAVSPIAAGNFRTWLR